MAPYGKTSETSGSAGEAEDLRAGRRRAARYGVPVVVAGLAAATIGLVPALADAGDPDLPAITAQELIEKIAASDTQQLTGTVKVSTDLGLPDLAGLLPEGAASGAVSGAGGESAGSSAAPASKLPGLVLGTRLLDVAVDGPGKQRVTVAEDAGDYSLIHNDGEVWAYDSASKEAFHAQAPEGAAAGDRKGPQGGDTPVTPKEFAEEVLKAAGENTSVTVDGTAQVAGRDAYQLLVRPEQTGSTIESVRISVDAQKGVPLKFTLTPSSGGKAAIDVGFSKVDFAAPAASTFDFVPPEGTKVTEAKDIEDGHGSGKKAGPEGLGGLGGAFGPAGKGGETGKEGAGDVDVIGEGWTTIAALETGEEVPADAEGFLGKLGDPVSGKFGKGTVFSARLVNALMTDDGKVYVGAVTKDVLLKAADAAK